MPQKIKEKIYNLTDSFLVEAKDQYGNERSLERLNQDRHLFVERILELFEEKKQNKEVESWEKEEWGGWKIVSDMLDHPDESGIYPTGKCYQRLYDFVCKQKEKTRKETLETEIPKIQKELMKDYERDIERAREEEQKRVFAFLEDHYWDSFDGFNRNLILKHLKEIKSKLKKQ